MKPIGALYPVVAAAALALLVATLVDPAPRPAPTVRGIPHAPAEAVAGVPLPVPRRSVGSAPLRPAAVAASPGAVAAVAPLPIAERAIEVGTPKRAADPDTVLVSFADDVSSAERNRIVEAAGGTIVGSIDALGVDVISVESGSRPALEDELASDDRVERVEDNLIRHSSDDPNDEELAYQGNIFGSRLPAAWDVTHGKTTTDIAILDTGIDLDHPDLAARIGVKRDVLNGDGTPADDNGHGTFVAGVAAGDTDNQLGIAGAAWDARIMPVKVLDASGEGNDADIAAGIVWATDNGAEIINMSLGGVGYSQTLADAVVYAVTRKVFVVAASGNEATTEPSYPAAFGGVLAVGATDNAGDVVGFSNRGTWVDVVAPGFDIVSTVPAPGAAAAYAVGSGTSFSAPLVAGVAALVKGKNPTFTPAQLHARLRSTAIDRGPSGIDEHYGWGLVDAYAAVGGRTAAAPPPAVRDAAEPDDTAARAHAVGTGASGTISPEGDVDWYTFEVGGEGNATITVTPPAGDGGAGALTFDPSIAPWSHQYVDFGTFDASGPGQPEVAHLVVGQAGTYRVAVSNSASSRSTGTAVDPEPYTVEASFVPASLPAFPNDMMWVKDVTPAPFASNVAKSVSPVLQLQRDFVTEGSAESATNVRLLDAKSGASVAATRTFDSAARTITIDPAADLVDGRTYTVTVNALSDSSLATMSDAFVARFTVAAPAKPLDLRADFNNDGFEDVVIGAPGEDVSSATDGGVVHVLYGSAAGPKAVGSQMWSQNSAGVLGGAEAGDRFGEAVASGDLNNDGYDDLIVGAPFEDIGTSTDSGVVHVLLGSSAGVRSAGNTMWSQDAAGVPGVAEKGDRFGAAMATGTFDGVAGLDVAVGAPGEAVGSAAKAGAVTILRGAAAGLTGTGSVQWIQDSDGIAFFAEAGDAFGAALASGDLHGDGNDDLVIGAPSDDISPAGNEGSVVLMRGSVVGARPAGVLGDVFSDEDPEAGDLFGASVAIADVGGLSARDGYADLIIGVPGEGSALSAHVGAVAIAYSDHADTLFSSTRLERGSGSETNDYFGTSISARAAASGTTLSIGSPYATVGELSAVGTVARYAAGAAANADGYVSPASSVVTDGPPVAGSRFGIDVSLLDMDGDDVLDVLVGSPFADVAAVAAAGSVTVFLGPAAGSSSFSQNTTGVPDAAESGDRFGLSIG